MNTRGLLLWVIFALTGCVATDGSYVMPHLGKEMSKAAKSATDPHWGALPELGDIQTALLHARFAKTPIPYSDIAFAYKDVAAATDEFQRRDRIADARVRIDRANQQLEGVKAFVVRMDYAIPDYQFEKGGFPTSLTNTAYIPVAGVFSGIKGAPYAIALTNAGAFSFAPVPEAAARKALAQNFQRKGSIDLEVEPVGAEVKPLIPLEPATRVLSVRVLRIRIVAQDSVLSEVIGGTAGPEGSPAPAGSSR